MTGYQSKKAAARDKLDDDDIQVYQRPWVDLTDEEFDELEYRFARYELCRAIGAALRSKNTWLND